MSADSPTKPRVVVTFHGGPCEGIAVLGEGKSTIHSTAAMAYRRYCESPSSAIGCHVWDGLCKSDGPADYYTIAQATEGDGKVEMVCEYEGTKQRPAKDR